MVPGLLVPQPRAASRSAQRQAGTAPRRPASNAAAEHMHRPEPAANANPKMSASAGNRSPSAASHEHAEAELSESEQICPDAVTGSNTTAAQQVAAPSAQQHTASHTTCSRPTCTGVGTALQSDAASAGDSAAGLQHRCMQSSSRPPLPPQRSAQRSWEHARSRSMPCRQRALLTPRSAPATAARRTKCHAAHCSALHTPRAAPRHSIPSSACSSESLALARRYGLRSRSTSPSQPAHHSLAGAQAQQGAQARQPSASGDESADGARHDTLPSPASQDAPVLRARQQQSAAAQLIMPTRLQGISAGACNMSPHQKTARTADSSEPNTSAVQHAAVSADGSDANRDEQQRSLTTAHSQPTAQSYTAVHSQPTRQQGQHIADASGVDDSLPGAPQAVDDGLGIDTAHCSTDVASYARTRAASPSLRSWDPEQSITVHTARSAANAKNQCVAQLPEPIPDANGSGHAATAACKGTHYSASGPQHSSAPLTAGQAEPECLPRQAQLPAPHPAPPQMHRTVATASAAASADKHAHISRVEYKSAERSSLPAYAAAHQQQGGSKERAAPQDDADRVSSILQSDADCSARRAEQLQAIDAPFAPCNVSVTPIATDAAKTVATGAEAAGSQHDACKQTSHMEQAAHAHLHSRCAAKPLVHVTVPQAHHLLGTTPTDKGRQVRAASTHALVSAWHGMLTGNDRTAVPAMHLLQLRAMRAAVADRCCSYAGC